MKPVVLLFGPTASGKSALALSLAERFSGEIVSADSMQVYRGMDIGTAKATSEERARVPHHCIDLCEITDSFSVAEYRAHAKAAINEIHARRKLPFVVGGTGLYFDALRFRQSYGESGFSPELRKRLGKRYETEGAEALYAELSRIDPERASAIHANDAKRVLRALEIYYATGKAPTSAQTKTPETEYRFLPLYLNFSERAALYCACDTRVDRMMAAGLLNEVQALLARGLERSATASQAIGYKELIPCLNGGADLSDAVELIKRRTRNYAKRQITWFSREFTQNLVAGSEDTQKTAETLVTEFLKESGC